MPLRRAHEATQKRMKNVFFQPWVGKDYGNGGIFGKKILVVGESHYCGGCPDCGNLSDTNECAQFTTEHCIKPLLAGSVDGWTPTFRKFERSLVGHTTDLDESNRIWQSLAFYNYLQTSMDVARKAGSYEDYRNAEPAFFEVLEHLRPDVLIAWGVTRMYDNMPGGDRWTAAEDIVVDNYHIRNGWYTLQDGTQVKAIWVYHPSVGYSWEWWNKVINKVINE